MDSPMSPTEAIQTLNRAWRQEDAPALAALLRPDVIILTAALEVMAEGREETMESYLAFAREARVFTFDEYDWREHVVDQAAIVAYRYRIDYERADERRQDDGTEMFWLVNDGSSWRIACRVLLFSG